jgi:nucleoid DNA-binding protein
MVEDLTNYDEFARQMKDARKRIVEVDFVDFVRKVALTLIKKVVERTPVDTGRARGNWQVSLNTPRNSEIGRKDKTGEKVKAEAQSLITNKFFEGNADKTVIWLANNVPYILVLEFGQFVPKDPGPSKDKRKDRFGQVLVKGGFSVQAPHGMVDVSLGEVNAMFPH